jgi:hypothetical protein
MSPGPSSIENPIFLTTLQNILAVLEDDVSPLIPENTYLTLVNQLQILYGIHNNSGNISYTSANYSVYDSSANYSAFGRIASAVSSSNSANASANASASANFTNVLSILERLYAAMSYVERDRAYENNNYATQMNIARNYWNAMSLDEQRDYRSNMRRSEIEYGGPVHRIIYPRS